MQSSKKSYNIYGLYDPRKPKVVMVVGATRQKLWERLEGYVHDARREQYPAPSLHWCRELLAVSIRPKIRLLATATEKNWESQERRYISIWRKKNPGLLNVHPGGAMTEKPFCECGLKRVRESVGKLRCPRCRTISKRAYRQAHKEQIRAYKHDYDRTHKRHLLALARSYRHAHKKQIRAYNRDYWHAQKLNLTVAAYRVQTLPQRLAEAA